MLLSSSICGFTPLPSLLELNHKILRIAKLRCMWRCFQSFLVVLPRGPHPFPSRTRKLSLAGPMILRWKRRGNVGHRQGLNLKAASGFSRCGLLFFGLVVDYGRGVSITVAYAVEGMCREVCELLEISPRPLKAREIARVLSSPSLPSLSKREVNPVLYELKKYGIASHDLQYRWSICSGAIKRDDVSIQFVPTHDPEEPKRIRELGSRPISAPIGHWTFTLGREPANDREVWRIVCTLCGFQIGCRVQNHQQVYPLSGKLKDRRRQHDRTTHPDWVKNQVIAETQLLGRTFPEKSREL
jgi:hypothetical protein